MSLVTITSQPRIAFTIASLLDNSTLQYVYTVGALDLLTQFSKLPSFWHARVETRDRTRFPFDEERDWKEEYYARESEGRRDSSPPFFWNSKDDTSRFKSYLAQGYKPGDNDMCMLLAAKEGQSKVLRFLLEEGSIDPNAPTLMHGYSPLW